MFILSAIILVIGGASTTAVYALTKGTLSEDEAVQNVSKELNGEVVKVEKDWDDLLTYEMTVRTNNGYADVEMDAKIGGIIEHDGDLALSEAAKISMEEVEKIAIKEIEGSQITDLELDEELGKFVYEVELEKGIQEYDLIIDANTGEVISVQMDD